MKYGRIFRKITLLTSLLALIFVYPLSVFAQPEISSTNNKRDEQNSNGKKNYIIVLKDRVDGDQFIQKKKLGRKKIKKATLTNMISTDLDATELKNVQQDENVAYVEIDSVVEIASINKVNKQSKEVKNMKKNDQTIPWGVKAIGADLTHNKNIKGNKIKIAVLDTGVSNQKDLNVKSGVSFIEGNTSYQDDNGHGTHVAGTIAALDNKTGVIGVAPSADLYAVKVLDNRGMGSYSQVIQGVEWAIQNKMNVISMSFGGLSPSQALHDVIKKANDNGILVVAAAGNRGAGEETELYPALYSEVISVGATSASNQIAHFSSTGKELDIVAPGVEILSTLNDGEYGILSGTSMAVPHVTGAAALLWSNNKKMTNEQIKNKLYETATPLGEQQVYGHGLLNIAKALGYIDTEIPPVQQDPIDAGNEDTILELPKFDITKIDNELLIQSEQLVALQRKAYDDGNIPLAKQIFQSYNELMQQSKELHHVPTELDVKVPTDPNAQSMDMQMNTYFELKESDFKELINTYKQTIATFQSRFSDRQSEDGSEEISASAYDLRGNNQMITAGQSATVSLKLADPKSIIVVTVYPLSNPNNIVATTTMYNKPADTSIPYTWVSSSSTVPGEYKIKFHYPENSTSASDNYWSIFVEAPEPTINDTYEPNNNMGTAYTAQFGNFYNSYISSRSDKDYYKITANTDGVLDISLSVPFGVDYDFFVYDRYSNVIGSGSTSSNFEQARISVGAGATYYILVEGYNGAYSANPYILSIGNIILLPPTEPTGLSATSKGNSIKVNWNTVQGASMYYVKLNGNLVTTTSNTSYSFTGLSPGTSYNIEIAAANNAGLSSYSLIRMSTINETYEPNNSTSTAYTISPGNSYISYISSETDIDYYKFSSPGTGVMHLQLEVPNWSDYDVEITESNGTVVGKGALGIGIHESVSFSSKAGTVYYVKISGFRSSYSHTNYTLTLSNLLTSVPTAPTGLVATATDMSITLTWNRVSSATSYKILKDGVAIGSLSSNSYTITGLKPNTTYSFSVAASNPLGTSSYTNIVKSTTNIQIRDILLNSPIDVDLPKGQYQIFKFTPQVSGEYQISTGRFAGVGAVNDTVLSLSTNSAMSNIIAHNDDVDTLKNRFSQIRYNLTAGTSYYIRLKPYSDLGIVHARLSVTKVSAQEIRSLSLNTPIDFDTAENEPGLFVFKPSISGNYTFRTGYYGNDFNQEPSDTILYVYSDSSFLHQIDMNDDFDPDNGNYFSGLTLSLIGGTNYYFKVTGFMDGPIHARFIVNKAEIGSDIGNDFDSAYSISLGSLTDTLIDYPGDIDVFRFRAPYNGVYTFETLGSADTIMELYDQSLIQFDYNDDSAGASSKITNELYAGRTYYLKIYHYDMYAIGSYSLRVQKEEDNIDGEILAINAPITRMINYEGDEDMYMFIPRTSGVYVFRTTGNTDTVGLLLDQNENPILGNDDSIDRNFSITVNLSANVMYYLRVKHFDETKKDAAYTLIVSN
ncbi:Subtilisin E precursor [compost metagenome]